jgi:hypothetical protein
MSIPLTVLEEGVHLTVFEEMVQISGTTKFRSPNCIVFDHDMLIRRIFFSLLISMLLLHNCLFGLNVFTD